jgi:hypothetical protein
MEPAQKPVEPVLIASPPPEQVRRRNAVFAPEGVRRDRYHLPERLVSTSPIGYRTRLSFTEDEARVALGLLSLERPVHFVPDPSPITEQELFEEVSLGILSARQSTNFRGHRQVSVGPADSARVAQVLRTLDPEAPVLDHAAATHIVLSRPYRTPFTMLLTLVGHLPVLSLATVPWRIYQKKVHHRDDIPTIGYLQKLHLGVLADAVERAAVIASGGRRRANVFVRPFTQHSPDVRALEELAGMSAAERRAGWRVALVAQVGEVEDPVQAPPSTWRRIGANLLAFRSERIQPGVNAEDKAPDVYQHRQDMDVPAALVEQAGRAAYNAFAHWTGVSRDEAKRLLLLERVDVLTPNGKERLREIRHHLEQVTEQVVRRIPLWVDLPAGFAFRKNAARGKKAFALTGQRIYIGGLSRPEVEAAGLSFDHAVCATGAAAARSALVAEIMGSTQIPAGADLLAGVCLMAGPVNQNDVGKTFFGSPDLLASAFPDRNPTSLLVWTLKAKTVADPIGNEQQLLDPARQGALVDLRPGPHEVVKVKRSAGWVPLRADGNRERAFADQGNFAADPEGREIPGNAGEAPPRAVAMAPAFDLA